MTAPFLTALREKFAAFAPEQKEEFAALNGKGIAALEAFCKKHGIEVAADEKEAVAEYFKTGKLPLSDEELENVAGGFGGSNADLIAKMSCPKCRATGSDLSCDSTYMVLGWGLDFTCKKCGHKFDRFISWKDSLWNWILF